MLSRTAVAFAGKKYVPQLGLDLAGVKHSVHTKIPKMSQTKPALPAAFDPQSTALIGKMRVHRNLEEMRERALVLRDTTPPSRLNRKYAVGFVPTMGALHDAHLALIEASQAECVHTVVSIYVNPTQFGPDEDLDAYPRQLERDLRILAEAGVDSVFLPTNEQMYPKGFRTFLHYDGIEQRPEAKARADHFRGVATVCSKLFNLVRPNMVYIGQKDALQCVVLRALVRDYNLHMGLTVCPIVREIDGLAMSSRNVYLSAEQRHDATALYASLTKVNKALQGVFRDNLRHKTKLPTALEVRNLLRAELGNRLRLGEVDYVSLGDKEDMEEFEDDRALEKGCFLSLVVKYPREGGGETRLLDVVRLGYDEEDYWRLNERVF